MTFQGGNITVWDDMGSINAGRGSKTAVTASPPVTTTINGQPVIAFIPPAVGSGIRAVTYAPGYGLPTPAAGNIYLFAPKGNDRRRRGRHRRKSGNPRGRAGAQCEQHHLLGRIGRACLYRREVFPAWARLPERGAVTQGLQNQEAAIVSAAAAKLAQGDTASDAFSTAWLEVRVLSFFDVDSDDSGWESTDN